LTSKPASGNSVASETMRPLPVAVARCSWMRSIAAEIASRSSVGGCTSVAVAAKTTMPILVRRSVGDELLGGVLHRHQPARLDVLGAHAAGGVQRHDDGLLLRRQRDGGGRPRHR